MGPVFWDARSILFIDYLKKGRTMNSEYYIALLVRLKWEIAKNGHKWKRKSALSPRQGNMSLVYRNDDKTTWIALWIASTSSLFTKSDPQQLLAVGRPQKNASGEEIWLQWWSDIGNWGGFWGQKIVLQKGIELLEKHWNQCTTLERNYVDG